MKGADRDRGGGFYRYETELDKRKNKRTDRARDANWPRGSRGKSFPLIAAEKFLSPSHILRTLLRKGREIKSFLWWQQRSQGFNGDPSFFFSLDLFFFMSLTASSPLNWIFSLSLSSLILNMLMLSKENSLISCSREKSGFRPHPFMPQEEKYMRKERRALTRSQDVDRWSHIERRKKTFFLRSCQVFSSQSLRLSSQYVFHS